MSELRVLIMAGGTGGHVFPALALAQELQSRNCIVEWLGTQRGIEAKLVPEKHIPLNVLTVSGVRGKGIGSLLKSPWRIAKSIVQAAKVIQRFKPALVVGLGGYVAGPGGIAAWLKRVPLVIHEQNAVAGTTNRLLARFARRILVGFPNQLPRSEFIGNPVRAEIAALNQTAKEKSYATPAKLLVLGGSLGALAINELMPKSLKLMKEQPEVVHQCGDKHLANTQKLYESCEVKADVRPFVSNMAELLGWADLVVCRAGALTVAELAAAGLPAILVPYPYAIDDHQTANARWLEDKGAGVIFQQSELNEQLLAEKIEEILMNKTKLQNMSEAARNLAKTDATQRFASICLEVANG